MRKIFRYKDDVVLSYVEYGNEHGYPILVQNGLIASIEDYRPFERLLETGVRLICIARPGYGESSPYQMADMAEWGRIVTALVDYLGVLCLDVLATSSGAPYGYAIGHSLPNRVRNIFVLSGTPALFDEDVVSRWPFPVNRDMTIDELQSLATELFFSDVKEEDKDRDPNLRDAMMNDCFGIAQDFKLRCIDWGFRLSQIEAQVFMRHSKADENVPLATAEMTSKLLAHCVLETTQTDPHFSIEVLNDFIDTTVAPNCGASQLQ